MEPMSPEEVQSINAAYKEVFAKYDVKQLFHANTVRTALSFLKEGALISRQEMEERGLDQTPQSSDEKDKELGIYNDLFLDSVDICYRGGFRNQYGPVLFCYSLDVLDDLKVPIRITQSNPVGNDRPWTKDMTDEKRYFASPKDYEDYFVSKEIELGTEFGQHVTIPECPTLSFDHLDYLRVDTPEVLQGTEYDPLKAIKAAAGALSVCIYERNRFNEKDSEGYREKFENSYKELGPDDLKKMFGTQP